MMMFVMLLCIIKKNCRFYLRRTSEYVPDFVAETSDAIYTIETKAKNQMGSDEVIAKAKAAETWCVYASQNNAEHNGKLWKYLLIPHESVKDNMTLRNFEKYGKSGFAVSRNGVIHND